MPDDIQPASETVQMLAEFGAAMEHFEASILRAADVRRELKRRGLDIPVARTIARVETEVQVAKIYRMLGFTDSQGAEMSAAAARADMPVADFITHLAVEAELARTLLVPPEEGVTVAGDLRAPEK
jgi:hypothetical protein